MKKQGSGAAAAASCDHVQTRMVPSAAGRRHSMAGAGMAGFPLRLLESVGGRTTPMRLQVGGQDELGVLGQQRGSAT